MMKTLQTEVPEVLYNKAMPLVRVWREDLGITQGYLAAKMCVIEAAVNKLEKPNAKPRRAILSKVAAALGKTVTEIDI